MIKQLFNFIAPVFNILDKFTVAFLDREEAFNSIKEHFSLNNLTVLDIGCGTGKWSSLFHRAGAKVTAIDFAPNMIKMAGENYPDINFIVADADHLSFYENNSFDIVTASFVLHDLKTKERISILKEMNRISKDVIIFDYGRRVPLIPRLFEFFEGNRYLNYKKYIKSELAEEFKIIEAENLRSGGVLFYCRN